MPKAELRTHFRSARRSRAAAARQAADSVVALFIADLVRATKLSRVAAYIPTDSEPGAAQLIPALEATGVSILLPVLLDDLDLDWAVHDGTLQASGPSSGQPARRARLLEPAGPRLGPAAVGDVELVIAPGLAVDHSGARLGQGGGSYDRALARTSAPVLVPLYPGELVDALPSEPHDRPVDGALVGYESPHLYWTKAAPVPHYWHSEYQSAKGVANHGG
jgi:5-formyltetrahydrofolate cyclo-ligase